MLYSKIFNIKIVLFVFFLIFGVSGFAQETLNVSKNTSSAFVASLERGTSFLNYDTKRDGPSFRTKIRIANSVTPSEVIALEILVDTAQPGYKLAIHEMIIDKAEVLKEATSKQTIINAEEELHLNRSKWNSSCQCL